MEYKSNEKLRWLKYKNPKLTSQDIYDLLHNSEYGGPSLGTVQGWSSKEAQYNKMPGNSLDLLIIRLKEAGFIT